MNRWKCNKGNAERSFRRSWNKNKGKDLEIAHVMHRDAKDRESIDYFLTCKN